MNEDREKETITKDDVGEVSAADLVGAAQKAPPGSRTQGRARRLFAAWEKVCRRLKENPKDPKAAVWAGQKKEYEKSMGNIHAFGQENPPAGAEAGVDIDVPLAQFAIKPAKAEEN